MEHIEIEVEELGELGLDENTLLEEVYLDGSRAGGVTREITANDMYQLYMRAGE